MILSHQKFEYKGQALIEKLTVKLPFRHHAMFQNEGCFIYVSGASSVFGAADQKIALPSHDSVLLKCGTYFVDFIEKVDVEETEIYAVHLFPEMLKSIYARELPSFIKERPDTKSIKAIASSDVVSRFIDSINFYFENPTIVNDDLLELKIKELILILVQTKNAESIVTLISDLFTSRKVNLRTIVENHLFSNLSIDELAALSNMSASTFKREFKRTFEETPSAYFNSKKLERGVELLRASQLSINQIAYEVGFFDPAYFSRLFKKKYDQTPQNFREKGDLT